MKYAFSLVAAAGLASAYVSDYTILEGRSDLVDFEPHLTIIARALQGIDTQLEARDPTGSRSSSRRGSTHEMQPLSRTSTGLSRTNSWDSIKAMTDSSGKKQSAGIGRPEGDKRDASRSQQAVNAAQRAGSYARNNPAQAASQGLSATGSVLGAAGAYVGLTGNAPGAAACAAGAVSCNGAANLIDKYTAAKKTSKEKKQKRDLMARALMAEIAMDGYPEIEARSYDDDYLFDYYF